MAHSNFFSHFYFIFLFKETVLIGGVEIVPLYVHEQEKQLKRQKTLSRKIHIHFNPDNGNL